MMTKKKKIILFSTGGGALIIGAGLGVGLGIGLKPKDEPAKPEDIIYDVDPCPEGEHVDEDLNGRCDICNYPVEIQHSTSISGDPSAPFYLKVGENKVIKAKLSPTPQRAEEKTFTWKNSNTYSADLVPQENNTANAEVTGLKEGQAVFTATNDYSPDLVRNFRANIINYDDDNMYLWEYNNDDRAKFGYVNVEGKKAGVTDGVALLGSMEWTFHRSEAKSLQSQKGGLGFGKGGDPETLVNLTAHNSRDIKKIVIETASAKSLANVTVKIGDNIVINKKTPSFSNDYIGSVSYEDSKSEPSKLTGDISIQFDTPAYSAAEAESNPDYIAPGAVYLKSIWIEYYELDLEWALEKTYDFESEYSRRDIDPNSVFNGLTGTDKEAIYNDEEGGIRVKFNKVKKPAVDYAIQGYALTNSDIEITSLKSDEVIKKVTFKYQGGTTAATYEEYSSVFGGEPYFNLVDSKKGPKDSIFTVGRLIGDDNVNSVLFQNAGTSKHYVGIISISVKTIKKDQLIIDQLSLADDAQLEKTSYKVGESFDSTGLNKINVSFKNEGSEILKVPANYLTFYDASVYDESGNLDTFLHEGTTEVVTFLNGAVLRVSGIEVRLVKMNFEKVTSLDQIDESSSYLVTCPSLSSFARGSQKDLNKAVGSLTDSNIDFGDTMFIADCYQNDLFTFSINEENGTYKFRNFDEKHTWGVTEKGNASTSIDAAYTEWNFEFLEKPQVGLQNFIEGTLKIYLETTIDEVKDTYCLYYTGTTFNVGKNKNLNTTSNIVLYKLTTIVDPLDIAE